MKPTSEIRSFTGLRGYAALYVVLLHWYVNIYRVHHNGSADTGNKILSETVPFVRMFVEHGYLAVDLFFALSGFVLSLSWFEFFSRKVSAATYRNYLFRRFIRIFPLYLIATVAYFLLFHREPFSHFLLNLTLLQAMSPYVGSFIPSGWSLTNEWLFYLIFPFVLFICGKLRDRKWIIFFSAFVILLFISITRTRMLNWVNLGSSEVSFGEYADLYLPRGPAAMLRTAGAYLLGIFGFFYFRDGVYRPVMGLLGGLGVLLLFLPHADVLVVMMIPFGLMKLTTTGKISAFLSSKISYFLGLISYSIYVNHYFFIFFYPKLSKVIPVSGPVASCLYVMGGTILLSIFTYYLIEKVAMNWFRKRTHEKLVVQGN